MIAFDFLEGSRSPALTLLVRRGLPRHVRAATFAVSVVLASVTGYAIDGIATLHAAREDEGAALARLQRDDAAVRVARVRYGDVVRAINLARKADEIRASGVDQARRLVQIALRVPADAWLTSLEAEQGATTLRGRALQLDAVPRSLQAYRRLRDVRREELQSVRASDAQERTLDYDVRLEVR